MKAMAIFNIIMLVCGLKVQKPIKKIKRGRSIKYKTVSKVMAKTSRNTKKKSKPKYSYVGGVRRRV